MTQLTTTAAAPHTTVRSAGNNTGLGLFATHTLVPGDAVVAVERPFLAALDVDRLADTCYGCYRREGDVAVEVQLGFGPGAGDGEEVKLKACLGCRVVKYCGKDCQKSSWLAHHSLECSVFKAVSTKVLPNHIRAILRVLLLKRAGRIGMDEWESFMACSTHVQIFSKPEQREELANLKQMTKMILALAGSDVDEDLVMGMLMRVKINSLTLQTPFHDPIGLVLHPLLAKVNHSCDPNCYIRFPTDNALPQAVSRTGLNSIILTPLNKIKAGEEVTISYVDETMPFRHRKQELADRYFFPCSCVKCTTEEREEARLTQVTNSKLHQLQEQAKKTLDETGSIGSNQSLLQPRMTSLTGLIRGLFTFDNDWPLGQFPFPQLLHRLILIHIDAQDFVSAYRLTALLCLKADPIVYPSPVHPLRLVHTLLFVKLAGAIMDQLSSTSNTASKQLAKEIDVEQVCRTATEALVSTAAKTWTEQPWPWMLNVLKYNARSGSDSVSSSRLEQQRLKMNLLCDRTLESLKGH